MSTNAASEKEMYFLNKELQFACRDGLLSKVQRLVQARANVNVKFDDTPLTIATRQGHFDVVRFLLDNGASIDGIGRNK